MVESYVAPGVKATIMAARSRAFATAKDLGRTVELTLFRDSENDGTGAEIAPQAVLIVMAAREAATNQTPASQVVLADGELRKEPPFDVQEGDRFTLPEGLRGRVTMAPMVGVTFVRAPFSLEA